MRPHLYRSVIFLSIWVWVWVFKVAPISIGHLPVSLCSVWVFGPHLYRSVVHFVSSVFETAPILIGRFHVSSAFKTTPISIDHSFCQFSFWDHGYIDQSFPCQFSFRTAPISIGHSPCQFSFWDRTYIDRSCILSVQLSGPYLYWSIISMSVQFLGLHLYRSVIVLSVELTFVRLWIAPA